MSSPTPPPPPLTEAQMNAIRIVPRVTAGLSIFGSAFVLASVLLLARTRKNNNNNNRSSRSNNNHQQHYCMRTTRTNNATTHDDDDDQHDHHHGGGGTCCYYSCSWWCSCCYESRTSRRHTTKRTTRRKVVGASLLAGMSIADLLSSISYVVGDKAFPQEESSGGGAAAGGGTQATCNAQGFLCNLQVGAALYSCFLAWYFCLYIRYGWSEQRLQRWFEPLAHLFVWAFCLSTGSVSIAKDLYHPHLIRCYISGPGTNAYFWGFFYFPVWTSMFLGAVALILVVLNVRNIETRSARYRFPGPSSTSGEQKLHFPPSVHFQISSAPDDDDDDDDDDVLQAHHHHHHTSTTTTTSTAASCMAHQESPQPRPAQSSLARPAIKEEAPTTTTNKNTYTSSSNHRISMAELPKTRRVAYQAFGYTSVFLLVYVFPTASRIIQTREKVPPYWVRLAAVTMIGSQGLWTWLIYFVLPRLYDRFLLAEPPTTPKNINNMTRRVDSFLKSASGGGGGGGGGGPSLNSKMQQQQQHQQQDDSIRMLSSAGGESVSTNLCDSSRNEPEQDQEVDIMMTPLPLMEEDVDHDHVTTTTTTTEIF